MLDKNDPRVRAVADTIAEGLVEIFGKCFEIMNGGKIPPSPTIPPEKISIRRENIPTAKVATIREECLPPVAPAIDQPIDPNALKVPTWGQLLNLYTECALENYKKNFYPCERARQANVTGMKKVLSRLEIPLDEPYNRLTRQRISKLEDIGLREGKSRATIQTWRGYIKSITARWACLLYEDRGWSVQSIATQPFNIAQKAYEALPQDVITKIDEWIMSLRERPETREQFKFVWMMRHLAIRNGDVFRYIWGNFTEKGDDKIHSAYIPHKTSKNSKRKATWDLPRDKWMEIGEYAGEPNELVIKITPEERDEFQRGLNKQIKALLPEGRNKGLYELRKLSAHEAYTKFGRKAAVRKTGDSFDTLDTHYVDTSTDDFGDD